MLHSFFKLFSLKSATILLLCLSLGLSPTKGSAMCCVEDDCDGGIWWSRRGGRIALLAGGAIAIGAIAGAIAGYSASSCRSKHCHSSYSDSYSSGPGTQPFANQFGPLSSSSSSDYSNFYSSESVSPIILRNMKAPCARANKLEAAPSKGRRTKVSKVKSCQTDCETNEITFNFSLALSNHTGVTLFTPFVTTAEGGTIEGSPIQAAPNCTSLQLSPLTVSDAKPGTYRVGIRTAQVAAGRNAHWQGEFTSLATQSNGTTAYLNGKLKDGDHISTREYVYTSRE